MYFALRKFEGVAQNYPEAGRYWIVHICGNVRDKVGVEMAHLFKEVFSGKITECEYLDVCAQHMANNYTAQRKERLSSKSHRNICSS